MNKDSVEKWFENLENLLGTSAYNETDLYNFLKLLNKQKQNQLNIELLMEQIHVL